MRQTATLSGDQPIEPSQSQRLFRSDFYEIKNWSFDVAGQDQTHEGYNDCFCLVFVNRPFPWPTYAIHQVSTALNTSQRPSGSITS